MAYDKSKDQCKKDQKDGGDGEKSECLAGGGLYVCMLPIGICPKSAGSEPKKCDTKDKRCDKAVPKDRSKPKRPPKESKPCEIRAGIFYSGCDCLKRNGMQDKCLRSECQGSPDCVAIPPRCGPSKLMAAFHEEMERNVARHTANKKKGEKFPLMPQYDDSDEECQEKKKHKDTKHSDTPCSGDKSEKKMKKTPEIFIGPVNVTIPAVQFMCSKGEQ